MAGVARSATADEDNEANQPSTALTVNGKITDVTLFRDSALVTREVPLSSDGVLKSGTHEILVEGLPERLVESSVFAEGNAKISIRGVRVVQEPLGQSSRVEIRELDEQLKKVGLEIERLTRARAVLEKNLTTLDQMIAFSSQAANGDLNRGVLDAEAVTELLTYSMTQRGTINQSLIELDTEMGGVQEKREMLNRERSRLTDTDGRTRYQVRVFIDVAEGQDGAATKGDPDQIKLSYSVSGCQWSPQYSIAGRVDADKITLRYGAIISQLSGESWDQIRLTLSTTSPTVSASGPALAPLRVTTTIGNNAPSGDPFGDAKADESELDDLFGGDASMQMQMGMQSNLPAKAMPNQMSGGSMVELKMKSLRMQQRSVEHATSTVESARQAGQRDLQLNRIADQMQNLEFVASARKAKGLASDAADEVASQTYTIENPVSLESRRDQQLVEIVEKELTGEMYHVAIPLLSSFAYREVEVVNELDYGLLSGPASIYLDDRFVGTMNVPSTASGQRLTIGFGADGQLRTRRELVEKTDAIQGGNRRLQFEYRLVLNNFKPTSLAVRLFDRVPLSGQSEQIRITLGEMSVPASEDSLYQRIQKPYGLLRWDLQLDAATHGSKATDVKYDYTLEFDRNQSLSVEPTSEKEFSEDSLPGGMGGGMGISR